MIDILNALNIILKFFRLGQEYDWFHSLYLFSLFMKKITVNIILYATVFCFVTIDAAYGDLKVEKQKDLEHLSQALSEARERIKKASSSKGRDYLKLLPNMAVSRQAPYSEIQGTENYISASINTNQLFDITDRYYEREAGKRKALRRVQSCGYKIRKLIERKHMIKSKIWKLGQVKGSLDDPVDIARIDDRIDEHILKQQEAEIEIESAYAEIEYACVEVER